MNFSVIKRDEVRVMYEQAADKRMQIKIMADLMNCEEADVCDLLGIAHTKKRKHGNIVEEKAFEMYRDGATTEEIAKVTGTNRKTVCDWRKQNKLPAHALARRRIWEECEEKFFALYEKGMADDQIAEVCGVNPWNVRDWRKKRRLAANLIPGRRGGRKPQKDREYEDSLFRPLYERGMNDPQIEKETGINRRSVCEWRHRFNLPVNGRKGK